MGFYENGLERVAAVCVGATSVAFGVLPQGAIEVGIGVAGLAGFVMNRSQRFGPECSRVRKYIQNEIFKNYQELIDSDGGDWSLKEDLASAHTELLKVLEDCFIDRRQLAKSALTPIGFPEAAVNYLMSVLARKRPDLFSEGKEERLTYRYARDVVLQGVKAAVGNVEYYRNLEPELMFEMASAIGEIRAEVKALRSDFLEIREIYAIELQNARSSLQASEDELVSLISYILRKPVSRSNISGEIERSYARLNELNEHFLLLKRRSKDQPEIKPYLDQVEAALRVDEFLSLDDAEGALIDADLRYSELFPDREEFGLAMGYVHFFLQRVIEIFESDCCAIEEPKKIHIVIPSDFAELKDFWISIHEITRQRGVKAEPMKLVADSKQFHRQLIVHQVGPFLIDAPASLAASASSPRYKRIVRAISDSQRGDYVELCAKLAKLEKVIIGSFFKTLGRLVEETYGSRYSRIEFLDLKDLVSRIDSHSNR